MKFSKDYINIVNSVKDWKEAIIMASDPLLKDNIILKNYQSKMIKNVEKLGPYIVLSKDIAMPHARPDDGATQSAISVLKVDKRVSFAPDKNVSIIIALACSSDDDHINTLQYISTVLSNSENYNKLINANDINEIYEVLVRKTNY
ncbi:MAG: PTS sugar transporter subunit IIA [Helcococcus sp.]|nr:PTS sugar transporter subunit IIA [Helcococcus sp.]